MLGVSKVVLIGTCLFGVLGGVSNQLEAFINAPKTVQTGQQQTNSYISRNEAKDISLKDAGIEENTTTYLNIKFNYDDANPIYTVEMMVGENEFIYNIDAHTGNIIYKGFDINGASNPAAHNTIRVQFAYNGTEYEYDIDSMTGDIHTMSTDFR